MVGLPGIGHGGGSHGDLQPGEHVIKPSHPLHAVLFFLHGQMKSDPQEHLLRGLQHSTLMGMDGITADHEVQTGIIQKLVPFLIHEARRHKELLPAVMLQDVVAVKPLLYQITELFVKIPDLPF